MDFRCREYTEATDCALKRELFRISFPETIGTAIETEAHQEWKFMRFPDSVPSYQYVAADGPTLVGYYAAIPYTYLIDGRNYRCGMVCDVMTHPDHRGRGIFTKIGKFATNAMKVEGLAFTTGFPIRPEVVPGHVKVGWKVVMKLPMYLRPIGSRSFLPPPLRPLALLIDPILNAAQCWSRITPGGYSTETMGRDEFLNRYSSGLDDEYQRFIEEWSASQRNALVKSIEFVAWRTGAPDADYRFVMLRQMGRIVGLAVARPTELKGVDTLATMDFMVLPPHFKGSRALHLALRELAVLLKKDAVACMISDRWARAYRFPGSAYIRTPAIFSLIVKKLDDSLSDEAVYNGDRWHLNWIDSDDL